jgi:hypothetical protein
MPSVENSESLYQVSHCQDSEEYHLHALKIAVTKSDASPTNGFSATPTTAFIIETCADRHRSWTERCISGWDSRFASLMDGTAPRDTNQGIKPENWTPTLDKKRTERDRP